MKPILNTCFFICFLSLCNAQCYESSLLSYSESVKTYLLPQSDSLLYEYALNHYFDDIQNHHTIDHCDLYPEYFFQLTHAEFLFKTGNYPQSLKLIDEFLLDKKYLNPYVVNDYLQALLWKSMICAKTENYVEAGNSLTAIDSMIQLYSKHIYPYLLVSAMNTKALLFVRNDKYEDAKPILLSLLSHPKLKTKSDSLQYVSTLLNFGELCLKTNREDSTFSCLQTAESLLQNMFSKDEDCTLRIYIQYATYYRIIGRNLDAEIYFKKAESLYISQLGIHQPDYANLLRMMGNFYRKSAQYPLAEACYDRSLLLLKCCAFTNKKLYALTLTNQGLLFTMLSKRNEAEQNYLLAYKLLEDCKDSTSLDYVSVVENLANLYYNQSKNEKAEKLLLNALDLHGTIQGTLHTDYADCLNSLGNLYLRKQEFQKSEMYFTQAIQIVSDKQLHIKNRYSHFFNNLAALYCKTNQYPKAESLFLDVKYIFESGSGKMNRSYLTLLDNLAELYEKMNAPEKASRYYIEASKLRKQIIHDSFKYLASDEVENFMQRFNRGLNNFNKFILTTKYLSDSLMTEAFENELFYHGFILNYHLELNKKLDSNPELKILNKQIQNQYQLLSREYTRTIQNPTIIDSIQKLARKYEKQLGNKFSEYEILNQSLKLKQLYGTLKSGEAIIQLVNFRQDAGSEDSTVYAAFILQYGKKLPVFTTLCQSRELQNLFIKNNSLNADYVQNLYSMIGRGAQPANSNSNSLYELIWKKLEPSLKGIKTIYYIPAGLMHKVNIQAIPVNENAVAGSQYDIVQLTSCRQLLSPDLNRNKIFESALCAGGIRYDEPDQISNPTNRLEVTSRGISNNKNGWPELNHSYREIYDLSELLIQHKIPVNKLLGADASEEILKRKLNMKRSPGILHIATHGYFQAETMNSTNESVQCIYTQSKEPMMRTGLILAYGNYAWEHCNTIPGRTEDGILTAFEISQMNLHDTKLAVLSACETGLGEIRGTEGVFGLQRAFKLAGVKYIIMSLWQIPDYQTQELMLLFYDHMLTKKMQLPKAFKLAQMELKEKYNNPYFWAGFVLVQ